VGGVRGLGFQGPGDDPLDIGIGDPTRGTGSGFIDEAIESLGDEALAPRADGGRADAEALGDEEVAGLVGTRENDAGASGQPECTLGPTRPGGELAAFVVGQRPGWAWDGPCESPFPDPNRRIDPAQGYRPNFRLRTLIGVTQLGTQVQ